MVPRAKACTLVEFCFESRAADLPVAALQRIARHTVQGNRTAGLTGELRLEAGRFRQTVEGPCATLMALAARVFSDNRHAGIEVIRFGAIPARRFQDWNVHGFGLEQAAAFADEDGPVLSLNDYRSSIGWAPRGLGAPQVEAIRG